MANPKPTTRPLLLSVFAALVVPDVVAAAGDVLELAALEVVSVTTSTPEVMVMIESVEKALIVGSTPVVKNGPSFVAVVVGS